MKRLLSITEYAFLWASVLIAARIMAARTALPFMLPKLPEPKFELSDPNDLARRLQAGRDRCANYVA